MSVLEPAIPPDGELGDAVNAAGGLWAVPDGTDREDVVEEVLARGVRGLTVDGDDVEFLHRLPDLEFLELASVDLSRLPPLPRLRYLQLTNWSGRLSIDLPALEWFLGFEGPRGASGLEQVYSAPQVRSLWLDGMYRDTDLHPVTAPRLEALKLWMTSTVTSLEGIEQHADRLTHLDLFRLPKLTSLKPLAQMQGLVSLHIAGMRQVTTLEEVADIPGLRLLDIRDQKGIESLAPLAGHPTLEYLAVERTLDMDLAPLQDIENLKLLSYGHVKSWKGDLRDVTDFVQTDEDHPHRQAWHRLWWP